MSLTTSTHFASAIASGTDWRDTSKAVLELLEEVKSDSQAFNIGYIYVSDYLAEDLGSIVNLFRSVLNIEHWVGTVGIGVCGCGEEYIDQPAISAMVGTVPEGSFETFPAPESDIADTERHLKPWLEKNDPMLVITHGDPLSEQDPADLTTRLGHITGGFVVGGLSSSRKHHAQVADQLQNGGLSGLVFSQDIPVATTLSQGCRPIASTHTITSGSGHVIYELDERKAVDVFEDDIRAMAIKKTDRDPNQILVNEDAAFNPDIVPEEFQELMQGEMHVAFPVTGADNQDYLVRNIIGMDIEEGSITISQDINNGETLLFAHRDNKTVVSDLSHKMVELRKRVQAQTGSFEPKGALYVSCVARAMTNFGDFDAPADIGGEMALIKEIIGDVPMTGFYAGGEIMNARLYGYTGVLTLFL